MLEKPEISDGTIITCLHDTFGLRIAYVTFLPLGWVNNAVYRVTSESGIPYFLKLRRGDFNEIAVAVPAFLHAQRAARLAVCHSDLHGRNVLVGTDDALAIVDWDEPILAPKERDLMFIGGGVGGIWNNDQATSWFYQGYGQTEINLAALSYYRYARIVVDIAERSKQIFGMHGSVEERQKGLGLMNQFLPDNVVDIAHRTYQAAMSFHATIGDFMRSITITIALR